MVDFHRPGHIYVYLLTHMSKLRHTYCYSLQTSGKLMELTHSDGKLRVHYSDRLVTLLREVRQLSAFGFSIPAKIQTTAATADKFYKYGVILKQV